ncbi:hypothetical protein INR49_010281 [Caranx melampygus]|nr:hypothetical protein INR49_010281 [Caranx melampygus]
MTCVDEDREEDPPVWASGDHQDSGARASGLGAAGPRLTSRCQSSSSTWRFDELAPQHLELETDPMEEIQTRILKPNENQPEPFLTSTDEQSVELMQDQFELSVEPLTAVASVRGADPGSDSGAVRGASDISTQPTDSRAAPLMGFMTTADAPTVAA